MQYLKYGFSCYMAVGESHVKQVSTSTYSFGITICDIKNSCHNLLPMEEISEQEFNDAERRCRRMMFDARKLFNNQKTIAA